MSAKQAFQQTFSSLCNASYKHQSQFTFLSTSITDMDGIVNFAAMIVRNDNPRLTQVVMKFTETIQLLSDKPKG